jgi:hypothetical protein
MYFSKNLIIFNFCGYKKDKSTTFSPPLFCCCIGDPRSGILDPGWKKVTILDKHPGTANTEIRPRFLSWVLAPTLNLQPSI